jgi:enediyne biosynthesis protein E4
MSTLLPTASSAPPRRFPWRIALVVTVVGGTLLLSGFTCRPTTPARTVKVEQSLVMPDEPDPLPDPGGIAFAEVAAERGIAFRWPAQERPMRAVEAFGAGCALFDYDNDGWMDLLLVGDPHPALYRNLGGGTFADVSDASGLIAALNRSVAVPAADAAEGTPAERDSGGTPTEGDSAETGRDDSAGIPTKGGPPITRRWIGAAIGDYDGDGWLDVLITGFHRVALLKNHEGKSFSDVTVEAGLPPDNHEHWGASAGWMDLDNDGLLDLVLLNYVMFGPDSKQYCELSPGVKSGCPPREYPAEYGEIWHNDGQGKLSLVPDDLSGMNEKDSHGICLVIAFTDLDRDSRMDFYLGNDGTPAEFMRNLGGMKFRNDGSAVGLAMGRDFKPMAAMGADWGDFDRDGLLDLTITDFQKNCFALFRQDGEYFTEVGNITGISMATCNRLGFGAKWLDMDNDRWLDVSYANGHVYDNVGDIEHGIDFRQPPMLFHSIPGEHSDRTSRRFVDLVPVLDASLGRPLMGRGSATGDINNDGRIDLVIVDFEGPAVLLENRSRTDNHWITLDLRSAPPNAFAYGALVTGKVGKEVWVSEVSPASSYLSSSDPRIHWGLGPHPQLDELTIRWPSGRRKTLTNVAGDQILRITEARDDEPAAAISADAGREVAAAN